MDRTAVVRVVRLAAAVVCLIALSGCRLDTTVDVKMEADGSGVVRVVAVADAELVTRLTRGGADSVSDVLSFDDAIANGWVVSEPILSGTSTASDPPSATSLPSATSSSSATVSPATGGTSVPPTSSLAASLDTSGVTVPDGGVAIVLSHTFAGRDELANVLNSIGPPLSAAAVARTTEGEQTTTAVIGTLGITGGYEAFTDPDLVQAVNGVPFAAELAASTPAQTMSFTYRIALPGELLNAGTGTSVGDGYIEWKAPLDGSQLELQMQTVQRPGGGGIWRWLSWVALAALIAWVVFSVLILVKVLQARRRRKRRGATSRRAPRPR